MTRIELIASGPDGLARVLHRCIGDACVRIEPQRNSAGGIVTMVDLGGQLQPYAMGEGWTAEIRITQE
jgi:hypothetical protein